MKKTGMTKKAYRAMVREKRAVWAINPVTRCKASGKAYNRSKSRFINWEE